MKTTSHLIGLCEGVHQGQFPFLPKVCVGVGGVLLCVFTPLVQLRVAKYPLWALGAPPSQSDSAQP